MFFGVVRFGLVAFLAGALAFFAFVSGPMVLQPTAWYSGYDFAGLFVFAALTFYGFYTSLGEHRLIDITAVDR